MSLLAKAVSGFIERAWIIVLFGINGIGKSTWASQFPKVIFADLEDGTSHLQVHRLGKESLSSFQKLLALVDELLNTDHHFKTFVIDSAEALEHLIHQKICEEHGCKSIEDLGYGKGYAQAREIMTRLMHKLQQLRDRKGMTVIILAHAQIKTVNDPATNQAYDRFIMRGNDKFAAVLKDYADNVFFATHKVYTTQKNNKTQAFGDGERVMYTEWRPGFDAKNRLNLPFEIDLSYQAFKEAYENAKPKGAGEIVMEIGELSKGIKDETLKAAIEEAVGKANGDIVKLNAILNRVKEKLNNS